METSSEMEPAIKPKRQRLIFSEKLMFSFINDYKMRSCLWDTRNPDYKCGDKRRSALAALAAKYDISEEEAKKKINSLRSTYLQEKKKVEESRKASGGETYEPSLYWFQELEFLYEIIVPRKTPFAQHYTGAGLPHADSGSATNEDRFTDVMNQEVGQEHLIFEFVPEGDEKIFGQRSSGPEWRRKIASRSDAGFRSQQPDRSSDRAEHRVSYHSEEQSVRHDQPSPLSEDEFDKFCGSIASQLRTLPAADAIEMQLEIQQLVSRRRLTILRTQQNASTHRTWDTAQSCHRYRSPSQPSDHEDKPTVGQRA